SGGLEVTFGDDTAVKCFIRKSDLSRDRAEQRPERFAVGEKIDARITNIDKATRRISVSIKALEIADEREAVEQYGSSDAGASLGDILGAAMQQTDGEEEEG
ncbi:MAG: S1 RNA-binding domain-containing protein, partial [Maricaulis sp.]|nr:S1 RNA-binding domain-containing protein [Maricaulis sp.]